MSSIDDPQGGQPPAGGPVSNPPEHPHVEPDPAYADNSYTYQGSPGPVTPDQVTPMPAPAAPPVANTSVAVRPPAAAPSGPKKPPPPPPPPDEEDPDEEGMARMSFMEHLEELRTRILHALGGVVIIFFLSLIFSGPLWDIISAPAVDALHQLGLKPPFDNLAQISPMDVFNIIWMKLPLLVSIYLGSPWIVYQVWKFIAPGLYKKERRWAAPFILCTAGLFILGGCFAYFVAFRYGLVFLLGLGMSSHIQPMISVVEYFDLFVDVMLGIGLVFEMPIIIFFLTLLRLASPRFLLAHSRYAILGIVILAAIVTPTPDVFNLMLFATPMCLLFYVGIFASYLLVLKREGGVFPWAKVLTWTAVVLAIVGALAFTFVHFGLHFVREWPFLKR
jgi:sec-independent protein translocase protein TatC